MHFCFYQLCQYVPGIICQSNSWRGETSSWSSWSPSPWPPPSWASRSSPPSWSSPWPPPWPSPWSPSSWAPWPPPSSRPPWPPSSWSPRSPSSLTCFIKLYFQSEKNTLKRFVWKTIVLKNVCKWSQLLEKNKVEISINVVFIIFPLLLYKKQNFFYTIKTNLQQKI